MGDMTGIFRDIQNNRREARIARCEYGVYRIGSKGRVLVRPSAECETLADAEATRDRMEALNPGVAFVVKPLA